MANAKEKHDKHKDHIPMALYLNPPNQLVFKGPFTSVVTSPLSLTNPTDKTIAFKVMVTAPKHYCCRPAVGYVKPNETVELQVMVEPLEDEKKLEAEKHKFMVQALVVRHAPGDKKVESMEESVDDHSKSHELKELPDPHDFWQLEHPKKDIMYHKFPVAFFQPNQMTKEQLETTVRELTSRAAAEAADEMEREREREDEERREREILLKKGKNLTPEERARLEMLQALAQIALAKKNIHGILRVTPPEELVFHGPYTEYTGAVIRLHNPSDRIVYYKVMNTNPQHYMIKPSFGILKPGETVVTTCLLEQQDQYARMEVELAKYLDSVCLRDKFMVHAAYSPNATTPIPQFWKNLTAGQVQVTKLKVVLALLTRDELQKERERIAKVKADGIKKKEKEKKTAIEFQEDNIDERILRLAPLHELFFNPPYTQAQDGYVQLFNPSDQFIYYKVFTTMPKLYMLKPSMGMLKPHQGIGIVVRLDAVKDLQELCESIHKLVVQAVFHSVDGENGDMFWKRVDPEAIKTAQIRISFRGLPPGIEKMMKKKKKQKKPKVAGLADVVLEDKKFRIEPEKELVFKGPFTEVVTSPVTLYNDTDRFVYYKILVNAQKHYAARPNVGVVPPHKFGMITFMLEPLADYKKLVSEGHKICVQYCEREIVTLHPKEFWQRGDANRPTTIKIPIGFQPVDPNAPPMVPGAAAAAALAAEKGEAAAAVANAHKTLLLQADKTAQYFGGPIEINSLPKPAPAAGATTTPAAGAAGGEENEPFVSAKENQSGAGAPTGAAAAGATAGNKVDAAGRGPEDQPPIQSERAGGAVGPGGSVRAMDYKGAQTARPGVAPAAKPGQAGGTAAAAGGPAPPSDAPIQSERVVGGAAGGYGGSVRAMDHKGGNAAGTGAAAAPAGGQNAAKSPGGGSTPEEPMQSERVMGGGAGAGYGGSVRAMDQKQSGGATGGNQNAGGQNYTNNVGPGGARGGSMMIMPGGNIGGSAYAVPNQTGGGYATAGGSNGGGGAGGFSGGNNAGNAGGTNNNGNAQTKNEANQGPQAFLAPGEKMNNRSLYMG